jgi:hypothetical protein
MGAGVGERWGEVEKRRGEGTERYPATPHL